MMTDIEIFKDALDLAESKKPFAIATVIEVEGSTLAKPGFKLLIDGDGVVHSGSLGGGCPESAIMPATMEAIKTGNTKTVKVHLENSENALQAMVRGGNENEVFVETFCGGNMTIFVEPYLPEKRVIVVSQGGRDSVEDALLELLQWSEFETVLITPSPVNDTKASQVYNTMEHPLEEFDIKPSDFVVVMTKGEKDIEVLTHLSRHQPFYVGLMASRKRVSHDIEELRASGVPEDFLSRLHAPIGIDINAITPKEIALSIVSELVKVSRESSKKIAV